MYQGTITALITPFRKEKDNSLVVDYDALDSLVEWQLNCGINGFVVLGTTAESATLDHEEKVLVVKRVMNAVKKRVPIIVGTGTNNTRQSIELTKEAKALGADAALVVSPYYVKPTQEGLYQHFLAIAQEGGLPVVIYNIPGRTSVDISTETFARLAKHPEFIGVKEASGSAGKIMELAEVCAKMALYAGDCNLTYLVCSVGGKGVISASANVIPAEMVAITSAAGKGKWEEACQAQIRALPSIRAIFAETNPAPAKAALEMMGQIPSGALRLPLVSVKSETRDLLRRTIPALQQR